MKVDKSIDFLWHISMHKAQVALEINSIDFEPKVIFVWDVLCHIYGVWKMSAYKTINRWTCSSFWIPPSLHLPFIRFFTCKNIISAHFLKIFLPFPHFKKIKDHIGFYSQWHRSVASKLGMQHFFNKTFLTY